MPYAAITYQVKPGHEEEIADIFARFKRVDSPILRDSEGNEVGKLLGTAVFIHGEVMVRVIHFEGDDFSAVGRHMATQQGVHNVEAELAPYLKTPRDTSTVEAFEAHMRRSVMRCVSQLSLADLPASPGS
ncbi:SchA/CurD like domain-containing protein [Amycolatopsis arida]|uniref:SchA/CurD like domain-containing protein n=1 Tax=Amycolatopsis arida TaxID=587909 RepID=A0A1I6A8R1_9PSEU|nr:SchA/CurD-like domain-containing protein [Amycolatopsis arida]TDX88511.1 SchA/CurD like domain-containing protein [Amycolatopsis arida]SFQ65114.1 SchA/CurD like domain-containing protein [Amycolatopsis arida]